MAQGPPTTKQTPEAGQVAGSKIRSTHCREGELLPALCPASRALLRSQSGTHAGAWLTITPCEPAMTLEPQAMQLALRRRLRLPLPLCPIRCGPGPGCGQRVDPLGDHAPACPRTGLLARRAKTVDELGSGSRARLLGRTAKSSRNNGWLTPRRPASARTTDDAWTLWCTAPRHAEGPCAVTQHWFPFQPHRTAPARRRGDGRVGAPHGRTPQARHLS